MYNTPSSRTSKHGSSRKAQRNIRQHKSRPATPITTDTPPAIMDAPAEASLEEPKLGLDYPSPEVPELNLEAEEVWFGQEAPVVDDDQGGELSILPPLNGPREEEEQVAFNPFAGFDDTAVHESTDNPALEFPSEFMPTILPAEPAVAEVVEVAEQPVERAEPEFGALSDIAERVQEADETVPAHGRPVEVTGPPTAPSPPPQREPARTRAPILVSRSPSSPSTLSRQLQSVQQFLPTSPPLSSIGFSNPLSNFAAPRISNVTVSGSSFNRPSAHPTSDPFVGAKESRRRSTGNFGERDREKNRARQKMTPQAPKPDDSDEEDILPQTSALRRTRYPSTSRGKDKIVFASFATVCLSTATSPRRLLCIGYENGLQIWDTTHVGEVQEVLNHRFPGAVIGCDVLPAPRPTYGTEAVDTYADRRPLIGIVIEEHEASNLLVYSLATHEVIKKFDFSGALVLSFQASNSFIVVSTSSPTSLHILCSRSLNILHTIQSRQLATFSRPVSYQAPDGHSDILYSTRQDRPHPVFHLSSRLVAFASAPPSADTSSLRHIYPRMALPQSPSIQLGPLNVSQADIGNAALKVGGGLLSGMKVLGGMAVAAARGESMSNMSNDVGGGLRKFFSRSAPAATSSPRHERKSSASSSVFGHAEQSEAGSSGRFVSEPGSPSSPSDSAHVTVLDLQPLIDDKEGRPERLTDFTLPSGQVVAGLKFSQDGTSLVVVPSDGGVVRLYQIKPRARPLRRSAVGNMSHSSREPQGSGPVRQDSRGSFDSVSGLNVTPVDVEAANVPWHIYDLRRGRTSGVIESVDIAGDGRWVAIGTRKRTVHVFATNPYGGKPDEASHLGGKVKNINELQSLSTELRPIVRLRSNPVVPEQVDVPLVFTFISSSSLTPKFLPTHTTFSPSSVTTSLPSSSPPKQRQPSISPRLPSRPTNFQDILIFDPTDCSLSLRRMTVSTRVADNSASIFAALPIPAGTSISLPGVGVIGRVSPSPPKGGASASTPPTSNEHPPLELSVKDSTIATWSLSRESKWSDVKIPILMDRSKQQKSVLKSEWLAQAELSTCSRATSILPSSIYISHQFSFFALNEDYHALLRRWHFDIPATKIEVRREVEANAYTVGQGESFVSAGTSPQDVRQARSTLDGPLASAIHSGLDYSSASPPVIPMLPNGARPGSFKATIPIRNVAVGITEGVAGSLGRLGRGIKKVRSPRLYPQSESTINSVPLEFDEDEALIIQGDISREPGTKEHEEDSDSINDADTASNSGGTRDSRLISTPSTNNAPLAGSETEGDGWDIDGASVVEEVEQFDEISAAGFMDEEQMPVSSGLGQKRAGRKGR